METKVKELLDNYRLKLLPNERAWLAVTAFVDLSRNAAYDCISSETEVRRDTIALLGIALEMTLDDYETIMNYKGYVIRSWNARDQIIAHCFENRIYDHNKINEILIENGEVPFFNYTKAIK